MSENDEAAVAAPASHEDVPALSPLGQRLMGSLPPPGNEKFNTVAHTAAFVNEYLLDIAPRTVEEVQTSFDVFLEQGLVQCADVAVVVPGEFDEEGEPVVVEEVGYQCSERGMAAKHVPGKPGPPEAPHEVTLDFKQITGESTAGVGVDSGGAA